MNFIRSVLFNLWFAAATAVLTILYLPVMLLPRRAMVRASQFWSITVLWGLKVFAGLRYEVRGAIPSGGVLVAAKHMSMWETLVLYLLLDDAVVILKRELFSIPFYGWYVKKAGMIGVNRKGGASSLRKMTVEARSAIASGRTLLIFPEGTRKNVGAPPDYKPGVAGIYAALDIACIPAAMNSGAYWTGFVKKPGTIVLEFLPAIPPGLPRAEFMRQLQTSIETATDRLLARNPQ